jgi:hypothetical protein
MCRALRLRLGFIASHSTKGVGSTTQLCGDFSAFNFGSLYLYVSRSFGRHLVGFGWRQSVRRMLAGLRVSALSSAGVA